MKKIFLYIFTVVVLSGISPYVINAQDKNPIQFSLDLNNVVDDRLMVEMTAPAITTDEVIYRFPKIVPGTYSIYDFGRFIKDLKAFDAGNNEITTERLDVNSWKIPNAAQLKKITYWVDDTFDSKDTGKFIFEPAGTNISKDNFVINTHGFFGYFDDMKDNEYKINIMKPAGFYGSTALVSTFTDDLKDEYTVESYYKLVDSPMMYCVPDTAVINVAGTDVLVSVYSPNKMVKSKPVADNIKAILEASASYLGGKLPVNKYAFLLYFFSGMSGSGAAGALEHSNSSMYSLGEAYSSAVTNQIKHTAAHEFLHIITPLTIHSEEIGYFDYNNGVMSKHLWLYEGVTEYNAAISQVRGGVYTDKELLQEIERKISTSKRFNDTLPFTVMSKEVLGQYEKQYQNVYEKGALIGMALDIKLRSLSDGEYGLINLLTDLGKKYGMNKPFKDEELFDVITEMTYPEIRQFFADYVEGPKPLPLAEVFDIVGIEYKSAGKEKKITFGTEDLDFDMKTKRIYVQSDNIDAFGKSIGLKKGDQFTKLNGKVLEMMKIQGIVQNFFETAVEGDDIEIEVARTDADGKEKLVTLKGKVKKVEVQVSAEPKFMENPSAQQLKIRKAWMGR